MKNIYIKNEIQKFVKKFRDDLKKENHAIKIRQEDIEKLKISINREYCKYKFPNLTSEDLIYLMENYKIQVPVWYWPNPKGRYLRISAYLYNNESEYAYLAESLNEILNKV